MDFSTICKNLQKIYESENGFAALTDKCEELAEVISRQNEQVYVPVEFDSTKHKISSTMASSYLELLPSDDNNSYLKELKPVEIFNDSGAIFRAVALLFGISKNEDVRELRVRCLINALAKLPEYTMLNKEYLRPLLDPDEKNRVYWPSFIHEKEYVGYILFF